ncbi:4Fe-4S ferredoxin N-terminal domain-containing protein [Halegenticoccus tardaugens]|uniref:4Fe-4S ferredoxin N-terminal domain-containing protein n=1 Tax=Halegenticoccus tardaugens TaxID=2071624 RepID=UPI001E65B2FA|nr:4Fe-4S ferredoxin N-terminal domain-containing protein [Halegenticoccus tardaugens]
MTSDDSSIVPDDDARRRRMERLLDETEFDTELGLEMARDAQRLTAGEITEETFYERHPDAVVEEFGVDDRGIELLAESFDVDAAADGADDADGGSPLSTLARLAEDGDLPRREVMKKGGAAAAALTLGLSASGGDRAAAVGDDGGEGKQLGMVINLNNCDGCLACMVACQQENNTSGGANWMYVFTYEDEGQDDENFLVQPCQHCSDAPCEKVCPVGARHTREKDGLVLTDYDICIGCRYCQVSCPYGVNYFQWGEPDTPYGELDGDHTHDERGKWVDSRPPKGTMGKCTMCPSRQDGHRVRGRLHDGRHPLRGYERPRERAQQAPQPVQGGPGERSLGLREPEGTHRLDVPAPRRARHRPERRLRRQRAVRTRPTGRRTGHLRGGRPRGQPPGGGPGERIDGRRGGG